MGQAEEHGRLESAARLSAGSRQAARVTFDEMTMRVFLRNKKTRPIAPSQTDGLPRSGTPLNSPASRTRPDPPARKTCRGSKLSCGRDLLAEDCHHAVLRERYRVDKAGAAAICMISRAADYVAARILLARSGIVVYSRHAGYKASSRPCLAAPTPTQEARRVLVGGGFHHHRRRSCRPDLRGLRAADALAHQIRSDCRHQPIAAMPQPMKMPRGALRMEDPAPGRSSPAPTMPAPTATW